MIVIVVGMHCSGAAEIAARLHGHGVVMGDEELLLPSPSVGGDGARFENPRFRILNDRMAERHGYSVESWSPDIPSCRPGAITRLRMRRLIQNVDARHASWGFEDPRTCLTLDSWLREIERVSALDRTKIVHVVRDPDAVARALANRASVDGATSLRLWKFYNERVMSTIDAWRLPTHYTSYEDLREHPERTVESLLSFIGVPARCEAVDPSSWSRATASGAESERNALTESVMEMKSRLLGRVRESLRSTERNVG